MGKIGIGCSLGHGSRRQSSPAQDIRDLDDPEAGLTLTAEYAPESVLVDADINQNVPCILAFDVVGMDGSNGGFIFEAGGTSLSGYIGFEADGTLIIRVGSGAARWNTGTSYYELANGSDVVKGSGTLVVAVTTSHPNVRAYWNRVSLGTAVAATSGSNWAGTGDGQFVGTLTSGLPIGEDGSNQLPYSEISDLRYYENQTLLI